MSELATLSLARRPDALEIAEMSRDMIEHGLAWSWTPARVRRAILGRDSCVLIARRELKIAGFAIMHFGDDVAHLNLLAVRAEHRRQGLGRQLLVWLSASAVAAGVFRIDLELRETRFIRASGSSRSTWCGATTRDASRRCACRAACHDQCATSRAPPAVRPPAVRH
jgi:GNAT superfamily N-acetyltransferase